MTARSIATAPHVRTYTDVVAEVVQALDAAEDSPNDSERNIWIARADASYAEAKRMLEPVEEASAAEAVSAKGK